MGNPFFNAMVGGGLRGGPMNFVQFMNQMKGKNPNEVLNQMLTSGKINQSQLNQAQEMAKQMEDQLSGFKSMFGFN